MSKRNYSPKKGPLGMYRESIDPPSNVPEINVHGLLDVLDWRATQYGEPFLDQIIGAYRFEPVDRQTAKTYVGEPRKRIIGKEAMKHFIENRDEYIEKGKRQLVRIANNTDRNLTIFMRAAQGRKVVLDKALKDIGAISGPLRLPTDVALHVADAIMDFGHSLDEPYDKRWPEKMSSFGTELSLEDFIKAQGFGVGKQIMEFGRYAVDEPGVLTSYDGVLLMQTARDEQQYRLDAWSSRRDVLRQEFPHISEDHSSKIEAMSLDQVLALQGTVLS